MHNQYFLQRKYLSPSEMTPLFMLKKSKVSRENLARVNCNFILYFTELFTCLGKYSYIQYCIPFWTTVIDTVQCSLQKTSSSSSSSLFIIPSFPLLGLNMIWVASTFFYPLPYLLWCLAFSCLLPLPYSRSSLAYLSTGLLPSTSSSIALLSMLFSFPSFTWPNYDLNLIFLNLCSRFSTPHLLLTSSIVSGILLNLT